MGTIIIKIPGDFNYNVKVNSWQEIKKEIEKIEKSNRQRQAIKKLLSLAGTLPKDFKVSEDELHLQED